MKETVPKEKTYLEKMKEKEELEEKYKIQIKPEEKMKKRKE